MKDAERFHLYSLLSESGGLTYALLTELFVYDAGKLYRKKAKGLVEVGTKNHKTGYLSITLLDKNYYVHHIIWMLVTGEWPTIGIDHEDHNRSNNLFSNLCLAGARKNSHNTSLHRDSTSGVTGVHYDKSREKWMAYIFSEGKRYHLGRFKEKSEAIAARNASNLVHNFHPNHGLNVDRNFSTTTLES